MREAKFDKVAVGEFSCNFITVPFEMSAKGAFVNSKQGSTHGWTNNKVWSPKTIAILKELRISMEADMEVIHFEGDDTKMEVKNKEDVGGISEVIGSTTVTQLG
jgi:hypothetical protein